MLTAVTGINWGDEGKGRVIDLLAEHADIVARYQGGNNAGHTVVTEKGKFILNLLPSGILHPEVTCVLGTGMVIDLEHLAGEMEAIEARGVKVEPENLNSLTGTVTAIASDFMFISTVEPPDTESILVARGIPSLTSIRRESPDLINA